MEGGADGYTLNWSPVEGATGYLLYARDTIEDSSAAQWRTVKYLSAEDAATAAYSQTLKAGTVGRGRYFTVVARAPGSQPVYPLIEGPDTYVAMGDSYSAGEGVPEFAEELTQIVRWTSQLT